MWFEEIFEEYKMIDKEFYKISFKKQRPTQMDRSLLDYNLPATASKSS